MVGLKRLGTFLILFQIVLPIPLILSEGLHGFLQFIQTYLDSTYRPRPLSAISFSVHYSLSTYDRIL
jgi:hypothetical protein